MKKQKKQKVMQMSKLVIFAVNLESKEVISSQDAMPKEIEEAFDLIDSELHVEAETYHSVCEERYELLSKVEALKDEIRDLKEGQYVPDSYDLNYEPI
jgi:hypothetical protein